MRWKYSFGEVSRNPLLNFLWEFSKCSRVLNMTRKNIPYFLDKTIATLSSRNLQILLVATKNLFVNEDCVTYAVSFKDQLSHDIIPKTIFNFE